MLSTLKNILKISKSELKKIICDKGSFLIMVGGVFLYGLFYTIPFSNHIARNIPIGVIDNDNSELSQKLTRNLNSNEMLFVKTHPKDLNEAKTQYYKQQINAFIVIPKNFERDIKQGKNSFITSYTDSAFMIIYKQVASGVSSVVSGMSSALVINRLMKNGINKNRARTIESPFFQVYSRTFIQSDRQLSKLYLSSCADHDFAANNADRNQHARRNYGGANARFEISK